MHGRPSLGAKEKADLNVDEIQVRHDGVSLGTAENELPVQAAVEYDRRYRSIALKREGNNRKHNTSTLQILQLGTSILNHELNFTKHLKTPPPL